MRNNTVHDSHPLSQRDKSRDTRLEANFRINIKSESKITSSIKNLRKINNQKHIDSMYLEEKLKSLQKQVDEFKSRSNNSNTTTSDKSEPKITSMSLNKQTSNLHVFNNSVDDDKSKVVSETDHLTEDNVIKSMSVAKESVERKLNFYSSGKKTKIDSEETISSCSKKEDNKEALFVKEGCVFE